MDVDQVRQWVEGVLSLASMGSAHEIDADEELLQLLDGIEDAGIGERGDLVVTTADGNRFRVTVQRLDPDTGNPIEEG